MFLAHMPAGYVVSKLLLSQFRLESSKSTWLLFLGLLGSVFPDLDMFYFYLIDNRQHGHHSYWTHVPFYWISLLAIGYMIAAMFKSRILVAATTIFFGCILLHLSLDTFAGGGIKWLYPFNHSYFSIFTIQARHGYWLLNYFLHWTALAELLIISSAVITFWKTDWNTKPIVNRKFRRQT
ncbi:MAG: metal-dependent hydrolase [Gammaproteobacteria bacterium]